MIRLETEEIKKIELDILKEIDRFCKEHNKHYFLAYGTLIGAVRHKGFIPWDDDIDLNMLRDDYNWLIENYNKMNPNGRYKLVAPTDKLSRHSFVKVIDTRTVKIEKGVNYKDGYIGIDVDIFPIDGCPEDEIEHAKWQKKLTKVYKAYHNYVCDEKICSFKHRMWIRLCRVLGISKNHQLKKAAKLHAQYPLSTSKKIRCLESFFNTPNLRFDQGAFDKVIQLDFEGYKFDAPAEYDHILTQCFGDYMTPPPIEQQVTHHTNESYIKEKGEI